MSVINTVTLGLIHKDGEWPGRIGGSSWKYGNYWVSTKIIHLPTYITLAPMFLLVALGCKRAKIVIGRRLGYSGCFHCGMTWNYAQSKSIQFSETRGMFPLCEECFSKLPPEEIDPYIERLVWEWIEINAKYGLKWSESQSPQEIIEAAKAEVRRMKSAKLVR